MAATPDPYEFVTRQVIFAIAAALAMVIVMAIDYEWLKHRARALYVLTVLVLVGLPSSTRSAAGRRVLAIDLGPIQLQPAEFAKFTVLLAVCAFLGEERTRQRQLPPLPRLTDHRRHPRRPRRSSSPTSGRRR